MTEPTEATEPTQEPPAKIKKSRSPEQLEVLAKARAKAVEVRKANALLRKQEKDIERQEKEHKLKERKERVAKYKPPQEEEVVKEDYVEPVKVKKERKKKVVVVEESESSDDEEEVVVVRKKKAVPATPKPAPKPVPTIQDVRRLKAQQNYNSLYKSMFKLN